MDESNHDMVNTLTQQMDTIFNSLIQKMNQSTQRLATQMNRIADIFGAPQAQVQLSVQPPLVRSIRKKGVVHEENTVNWGKQFVPRVVKPERPRWAECPPILVVNQDQDADQVVRQV